MGFKSVMKDFNDFRSLTINGLLLKDEGIIKYCKENPDINVNLIGEFIETWLNPSDIIEVKTSGSTGIPKVITVSKSQMLASAAMTASYFGFQAGQSALLCLPMNYIAGKMMVVRALYSGLNLICVEPTGNPISSLAEDLNIDFAPFVPMQLKEVNDTKSICKILLGGAPIDSDLERKAQSLNAEIHHGYGMTETLSHVALRSVNGKFKSEIYHGLNGISFEVDDRGCLIIHVPFLQEPVFTNDVVELIDHQSFVWKGRADHIVNSGGIKLYPEAIEMKISTIIHDRFFVGGISDEQLGEKLCLFIESSEYNQDKKTTLLTQLEQHLEKYERPREVYYIPSFIMTDSGKIKRKDTIKSLRL